MRYIWLLFSAVFIYLGAIFISQNFDPVVVQFNLDFIKFQYRSEAPLFIPIFVTLSLTIFFCVFYFFSYHSQLRITTKSQRKEIGRLKRLVLLEREKNQTLEDRNQELNQVVERLEKQFDEGDAVLAVMAPDESSDSNTENADSTSSSEKD